MSESRSQLPSGLQRGFALRKIATATLAAGAAAAPVVNASFHESFTSPRLLVVLVILLLLHVVRCPRLLFCREFGLYAAFVGYMFMSLLWAPDRILALNTLFPAINFLIILILFGSLVTFHDSRAVFAGILSGFILGAVFYTYKVGFPFVYPENFSYNAIAGMYLFGLFAVLIYGWITQSRLLPLAGALILLAHIAATTSIKTNLGILLGAAGASLIYYRQFAYLLRRNAIALAAGIAVIAYLGVSNEVFVEKVNTGIERVSMGLEVLRAREDVAGYRGFGKRQYWQEEGLKGWAQNPLFGEGVEAFRSVYGITSHSTPVDLLYNTGLIGFSLFYAIFASIAWRIIETRDSGARTLHALILAGMLCQLFAMLSGTLHYQTFLAIFIALSVTLLRQLGGELPRSRLAHSANPAS